MTSVPFALANGIVVQPAEALFPVRSLGMVLIAARRA